MSGDNTFLQAIAYGAKTFMTSKLQLAKRALLFFSTLCFTMLLLGSIAQAQSKDINSSTPELTPNLQQAIAGVHVVQLLSRSHYRKVPLNSANMKKVFDRYLDSLDPNRSFFLQSDIKQFEPYRKKLGHYLKEGNLKPAFIIFNRYKELAEERTQFMLKQLDQGIDDLDLDSQEELVIERKDEPWLADKRAQHDLWTKQFKDNVLTQKLNNKTDKEIITQLHRRNTNLLRRLRQTKSEDVFQTFINAYAGIYDPHTQYFSPQSAENFDINMSLSLEGIGAVLSSEDEYTKVVSIVSGGPAEKAGKLKPGDKIIGVGQGKKGHLEDVVGMRLDDVVKLIRGAKHTLVRLEIIPGSSKDGSSRIYEIVRDQVKLEEQDAASRVIELPINGKTSRIGVIELPTFYIDFKAAQAGDPNYKSTTRDVRRLLKELQKKEVDGLIIDLRGNGGGSLQEANELTGLFIDKGPTVIVRNNRGRSEKQEDSDPTQHYHGPMVVMIDRLSASASEIFAGAMQDYGRALVVGSQSYGKGTVQTIQPLNHGQLKFTLAKFYRISGQSTQNRGVLPDITFPSLYDGRDIGEDTLPDALPWDTISPASYKPYADFRPYLPSLTDKHERRIRDNADFVYLHEMKAYFEDHDNQKTVSLNFAQRELELQTMRGQRLAIENRLRKSNDEQLLKNLDELEEVNNQESNKKENKADAFLREAGFILHDMVSAVQNSKLFMRNPR